MSEDLFKPTLSEDNNRTKIYDISKFIYVAFFGGVIPMVVLGTKNAMWLRIDRKKIIMLITLGAVILISQIIAFRFFVIKQFSYDDFRIINLIYKGIYLLLYLCYYHLMKNSYKLHILTNGAIKPLFKDAIIWILISGAAEAIILAATGAISYVL